MKICVEIDTLRVSRAKIQYYFYTEIGSKKFNRKLTLLGCPRLTYSAIADNPEGGQAGKRWWEVVRMVEGASRTGDNGAVGAVGTVRVMGAVR